MTLHPGSLPVRTDDPDPSYAAALKAAMGTSGVRPVVLALLQAHGPSTHDELIAAYHRTVALKPDPPRASESGIRTRFRELVETGLVAEHSERGQSKFGNTAKRWVAVDPAAGAPAPGAQAPTPAGLVAQAAASSAPSPEIGADDVVAFPSVGTHPLASTGSAA